MRFISENVIGKDILMGAVVAIPIGLAAALFLFLLEWFTAIRLANFWLLWGLPLGGFLVGWLYHVYGQDAVAGNNLIIQETERPKKKIPLHMAPLVFFGTLVTHLFGGSAGREGTAVQMGAAIADAIGYKRGDAQFRQVILVCGVSAGFAAVFGTPFTGIIFAIEVAILGKRKYRAIVPGLVAALIADGICHATGVPHVDYALEYIPALTFKRLPILLFAGALFGIAAFLFSKGTSFSGKGFQWAISYPPLRPAVGGAVLAIVFFFMGTQKYMGLGIQEIVASFVVQQEWWVFLLKIAFTAFTIGAGFKGGEVTPLFFIGATLGSALSGFLPVELYLLAALGFVGVFAGATNTPIACTAMAMELFGVGIWPQAAIICFTAYLFSGQSSIYAAQQLPNPKWRIITNIWRR
ncbi:MAG: chloride channel protein [Schleiferiaceae bacterium]|nr:chloride channel protein [Schleiferiaceae bacterium]